MSCPNCGRHLWMHNKELDIVYCLFCNNLSPNTPKDKIKELKEKGAIK